jgi:endogenous inhibitor of DNA gyrase (YacG/DUF329 family)
MTEPVVEKICTVQCRLCGKTVQVPDLVVRRNTIELLSGHHQLASNAFTLLCPVCQKEANYTTDEIGDCPVD